MFQAAFGIAAAKRLKTELKFDISYYKDYSNHRQFILDRFNIEATIATPTEIYNVYTCNASNFIAFKWNQLYRLHLCPYYRRPVVNESVDKFDLNFKRILNNTYVNGYFSSRDFFEDYQDEVRRQLTFKSLPSDLNQKMTDDIRTQNSVAISFRLGDFLTRPWHNVCSLEYYERCINYLSERYENLHFYVFSDDIDWVKKNFTIGHPTTYVDYNAPDYMEDFRLLSNFRFHIIPNSTFSWWGAYLANAGNKIVLCPEYWLSPDKASYEGFYGAKVPDCHRVLPDEWIRIPNMTAGDHYIKL
jgi:hypothetical protein